MFILASSLIFILSVVYNLYIHKFSYIHRHFISDRNDVGKIGFNIDFVYTWVDGSDPHHLSLIKGLNQPISYRRYANNDEIYTSFKSVAKHAPWVRYIYVVMADYQSLNASLIPDEIRSKIKPIKHSEIIPEKFLPHFASQVIESFLYKIPGLSEQFVYFNDDMFLGNTTEPNDFFHSDGSPYMLYDHSLDYYSNSIRYFLLRPTTRNSELRHSIHHFMMRFSLSKLSHYAFYKKPIHQCYPASRSLFKALWDTPETEAFLLKQAHDKFRSYNQLNVFYLMYLYGFYLKKAYLKKESSQLFYEIHSLKQIKKQFKKIYKRKPKLFCINNELDQEDGRIEQYFQTKLKGYFA